jgi:hypothetical protein
MLHIYIFYFVAIVSILILFSDMSSWKLRVNIARELMNSGENIDLSKDWNNLQPLIQQHIMYGLFLKYFLLFYCLIGIMTSQWIFFVGLISFRIVFLQLHNIVGSKYKGTLFNDVILPLFYRSVTILGLAALVINRFHYKFL